MYRVSIPLLIAGVFYLSGCASDPDENSDYMVVIDTPEGTMKAILYEETPLHKANFIKLAKEGKYDNTLWHRVVNDFMIQGGDVYGGNREPEGGRIPAEIVPGFYHVKGALAAARQGDQINPEKKSSSCQFYIVDGQSYERITTNLGLLNAKFGEMVNNDPEGTRDIILGYQEALNANGRQGAADYIYGLKGMIEESTGMQFYQALPAPQDAIYKAAGAGVPFLDNEYTVFGRVVEGLEVIDKLASVQTANERPVEDIDMTIDVKVVSRSEITEKYGYEYPTPPAQ